MNAKEALKRFEDYNNGEISQTKVTVALTGIYTSLANAADTGHRKINMTNYLKDLTEDEKLRVFKDLKKHGFILNVDQVTF